MVMSRGRQVEIVTNHFRIKISSRKRVPTMDLFEDSDSPQVADLHYMPRGSIKWRSGSTGLPSRPFVAGHFAASRNWSRESINTFKLQTATRSLSSGPPLRIRSSLKSNDYVKVFPGRDTSCTAAIRSLPIYTGLALAGCRKSLWRGSVGGVFRRIPNLLHLAEERSPPGTGKQEWLCH